MFDYGNLNNIFKFTHLPATGKTINIGDDIQVECAARLWHTRTYVERDDFNTWKSGMVIPFFGWYGYDLINHPPKSDCVLVSFHLCTSMMRHVANNSSFKDWLRSSVKNQGFPAMARDTSTMNFLRNLGIDCEFGGCVTQTLKPYNGIRSGVVSFDAPDEIAKSCDVIYTQNVPHLRNISYEERLKLAAERIDVYKSAEHIHTSRIHTYLPCKALGTPVTFYRYKIFEPHRLSGLVN
jgi:hypothetical protein